MSFCLINQEKYGPVIMTIISPYIMSNHIDTCWFLRQRKRKTRSCRFCVVVWWRLSVQTQSNLMSPNCGFLPQSEGPRNLSETKRKKHTQVCFVWPFSEPLIEASFSQKKLFFSVSAGVMETRDRK